MEQIQKTVKHPREETEIDELPELEPNEVSLEAGRFLVRLAQQVA